MGATYKVAGTVAVLGTPPGGTFDADLDPVQESRLIEGGHIQLVTPNKGAAKTSDTKE